MQLAKRVFRQAQSIKVEYFDFWDGPVGEPRVVLNVKIDLDHSQFDKLWVAFNNLVSTDRSLSPYLVVTREY